MEAKGGVTATTRGIQLQYAVDGVCWIVSKMEKSEIVFSKQIAPPNPFLSYLF